jgi:beta-lactamase class A
VGRAALISRRRLLLLYLCASAALRKALAQADEIQAGFADLERIHGGRLGVTVLDVAAGRRIEHRADEKFAMSSTYKFLAAAFVLARVDRQEDSLNRRILYSRDSLVPYSPITEKYVGDVGMTLGEICEAAMTLSDNTAGNLILESFGGPAQLTTFARSLGDDVTRLDRTETDLNEAKPGDSRDTTTPAAMANNVRKLVLGDVLSMPSRDLLSNWMIENRTGDKRLRAGIPEGWRVGDKTGSGGNAGTNDIAVIWPPDHGPIVVTAYFAESPAPDDVRNMVLTEVARRACRW